MNEFVMDALGAPFRPDGRGGGALSATERVWEWLDDRENLPRVLTMGAPEL